MAMETDVEIDVQIGDQIKCQLATSDGFFFLPVMLFSVLFLIYIRIVVGL